MPESSKSVCILCILFVKGSKNDIKFCKMVLNAILNIFITIRQLHISRLSLKLRNT